MSHDGSWAAARIAPHAATGHGPANERPLVGERQTIRFDVPDYCAHYAGYPVDTADLIQREGTWWLHVVVTVPAPDLEPTGEIKGFVEYKAEERGCTVAGVDPRHTSQTCSCCGHVARNNRHSRGRFVCRVCGVELHADLNAARNIAATYHAGRGTAPPGGPPVSRPIVSDPLD